jgi:hypothetical protein
VRLVYFLDRNIAPGDDDSGTDGADKMTRCASLHANGNCLNTRPL